MKLTLRNREAQVEAVPSASALTIKGLKEARGRKKQTNKQKNTLSIAEITFNEIVNTA